MTTAALVCATVVAIIFICVGIGALCLQARLRRLLAQVENTLDPEVREMLRAWREAAQGVQQAARKLDEGLAALARTLERVDRLSQKLEPDSLARTLLQPAVAKLLAWLAGVQKGLASVRECGGGKRSVSEQQSEGDRSAR